MTATARAVTVAELRVQELACLSPAGCIEIRIQRKLRSPNEILGRHWREKSRERKQWQAHIVNALVLSCGHAAASALLKPDALLGAKGGCVVRRRVDVIRYVPKKANFIRDDDNLAFAVKPLLDALKHAGLIRDDRRRWIELPLPTQEISNDGTFWTWIAINDTTTPQEAR